MTVAVKLGFSFWCRTAFCERLFAGQQSERDKQNVEVALPEKIYTDAHDIQHNKKA